MSDNTWKSKISNLDSFWDLDSLISTRRSPQVRTEKPKPAGTCEVELDRGDPDTVIKKYVLPRAPEREQSAEPELEYERRDSLIHRVRIYPWKSSYNYYETFYNDVKRYFDTVAETALPVPFFSYVPQYSQMTLEQRRWYFYWRSRARSSEFLPCDYSYILLYVFEIINAGELLDKQTGIYQLSLVWKSYHKSYPQLNKYLAEWICDYALVNGLDIPREVFGDELSEIMRSSNVKELYASCVMESATDFVNILLEFCSNYDYRSSRYYAENCTIYDEFIKMCLSGAFERGYFAGFSSEESRMNRDAYVGALCSYHAKKKIEIKYCSFSRTNELRYVIGDAVKYAENKIRAHLSIKSRLGAFSPTSELKQYIDGLAAAYFVKKPALKKAEKYEYDVLYDVPKKEFSLADAQRIENESWETTQRLVEAFDEPEQNKDAPTPTPTPTPEPPAAEIIADGTQQGDGFCRYAEFLVCVLNEDPAGQKKAARALGGMLDTVADEINALAADIYGDILIEEGDTGYCAIDEYRDIIKEITKGC